MAMESAQLSTRPKRSNAGAQMQGIIDQITGMRVQRKTQQKCTERATLQRDTVNGSAKLNLIRSKNASAHRIQRAIVESADPITSRRTKLANAKQHRKSRQARAAQSTHDHQQCRSQLHTIQYGRPTKEMLSMYESKRYKATRGTS